MASFTSKVRATVTANRTENRTAVWFGSCVKLLAGIFLAQNLLAALFFPVNQTNGWLDNLLAGVIVHENRTVGLFDPFVLLLACFSLAYLLASICFCRNAGTLLLELVSSTNLDTENITSEGFPKKKHEIELEYEAEFEAPDNFEVGAIYITNRHKKEMFIKKITLSHGTINLDCKSWVQPNSKQLFFINKLYLQSETPVGLKRLREKELEKLRGTGIGERKKGERIYDYDVYNDLGVGDPKTERPVLGGKDHPFPRRCRTGRPKIGRDLLWESRSSDYPYVPRDEQFSIEKDKSMRLKRNFSIIRAVWHVIQFVKKFEWDYKGIKDIDDTFIQRVDLSLLRIGKGWREFLFGVFKVIEVSYLRFPKPDALHFAKGSRFWENDKEFARQTLAGVNPFSIRLVKDTEWPLKSKDDPSVTEFLKTIKEEIKRFECNSVESAIEQKKLFMLDYHDLLLPYVSKVRKLKNTTLYCSRTLFILTQEGTLHPLCIELTRPPMDGKPEWKHVYLPDSKLWKLAKAHVLAHDSAHHQLISHFLRTHACIEPYIIAAHRQLSVMHPIYRLLKPHFRFTMAINAQARQELINSNGVIEQAFSPGKYSMEICSSYYHKLWKFDEQGLPKDLISRGMAVGDPLDARSLKLTIEDYPFANDGLLIWVALKEWVTDYVERYYPDPSTVVTDTELQEFWNEVKTKGHGDRSEEKWWPELKTKQDLIEIITTIAWVASAHHAAVNFGQYAFAGYFPNRPTIARKNMPDEEGSNSENVESILMQTFPSRRQATLVINVLGLLSAHSPDEEYLGDAVEPAWNEDSEIKKAFEKFRNRMNDIEAEIDEKNKDEGFKNRCQDGVVPYELLKPFSGPGVTAKGVPYSTSI